MQETAEFTNEVFEQLKNERKVFKYKSKNPSKTLTDDYLFFLNKLNDTTESFKNVEVGEVVNGKIIHFDKKDLIIDIGYKDNVYVDSRSLEQDMTDSIIIGENIDVMIIEVSEKPYFIKGSITELLKINISNVVKDSFNDNGFLFATVLESQPAGYSLRLEVNNQIAEAFMPNTLAGVNKLYDPSILVGQRIEVMIETLEQDKGIYVVSRKKYLESMIPEKIKLLKKDWTANKNKVYTGYITGTTPFGAFVEFEDFLTCMIHRYNINEEWQADEKWATLKPGMEVNFYIKDIISKKNKVISTQILRESLWDTIKIDDEVRGKVISVKPFGALIQLDNETNGLIQNTYLQKNKIDLRVGQEVDVRVNSIMKDERKINLSVIKND